MAIRYAFHSVKRTWFLHVEAGTSVGFDRPSSSKCMDAGKTGDIASNRTTTSDSIESENYITGIDKDHTKREGKRRRLKGFHYPRVMVGVPLITYLSNINNKKKKRKKKRVMKKRIIKGRTNRIENGCLGRSEENSSFNAHNRFSFFEQKEKCNACHLLETPSGCSGFNGCLGRNEENSCFSAHKVVSFSEQKEEHNACRLLETPSGCSSEVISVSGIIARYFSNFNESGRFGSPSSSDLTSRAIENQLEKQLKAKTDDVCSSTRAAALPLATTKMTPRKSLPFPTKRSRRILKDEIRGTEVGKRLVMASSSLGVSSSKQRPAISLCRYKEGKLLGSSYPIRSLVFELSDTEN
ncbi:uncharacterized protein LOC131167531 isoform X2 [Malania oleifera]|nr:uncharacterized protein LOC131167531 isoform X2 [Malania oleifera]